MNRAHDALDGVGVVPLGQCQQAMDALQGMVGGLLGVEWTVPQGAAPFSRLNR